MVPTLSRRRLLGAAGTLAAGAGVGTAFAGSTASANGAWPMARRDPAGTAHAPNATPPKDGVAVRWKRELDPDRGLAYGVPPVVAGGTVYAVGDRLLAVDAASGDIELSIDREFRSPVAAAPARAYSSPTLVAVDSDGITGLHGSGGLELLGSRVGTERWSVSSADGTPSIIGSGQVQFPPVAAGQTLLAATPGGLLAVDASSGRLRWRADVQPSRPVVHDDTVYAADYGEGILGYDLTTGDQQSQWQVPGTLVLGLTAGRERLLVATDDGLAALGYDGTVHWQFAPEDLSRDRGAIALADGVAYAGFRGVATDDAGSGDENGDRDWLVAVDAADGSELWRSPTVPESTPRFAPPAVANDTVYVPVEDEALVAVDAADGSVRWRFDPADEPLPFSPAALVGDACYVIGSRYVYALEEA